MLRHRRDLSRVKKRVTIADVYELIVGTNTELGRLQADMTELGTSLRSEIAELGTSLRSEIAELGTSLRSEIAEQGTSLRSEIAEQGTSLRSEIARVWDELVQTQSYFGGRFDEVQATLDRHSLYHAEHSQSFNRLERRLDNHEARISKLESS